MNHLLFMLSFQKWSVAAYNYVSMYKGREVENKSYEKDDIIITGCFYGLVNSTKQWKYFTMILEKSEQIERHSRLQDSLQHHPRKCNEFVFIDHTSLKWMEKSTLKSYYKNEINSISVGCIKITTFLKASWLFLFLPKVMSSWHTQNNKILQKYISDSSL